MRSEWLAPDSFSLLLTALMPENRLALQVSMATGLRISDVLGLRTEQLRTQRPTVKESKTGKARRVYIPEKLYKQLLAIGGKRYVFEGRLDWRKARTRQAVYKDLKRVAALYRLDGSKVAAHLSPHSARKIYAVEQYRMTGDLERVQRDLRHSDPAVTALYALADQLTKKARRG